MRSTPFTKYYLFLTLVILGILFHHINAQIPLMSDDILYSYIFPNVPLSHTPWGINVSMPIKNFFDILISQYNHYFLHGGRAPIHIIIQSFCALIGKDIFNFITPLFFVSFIVLLGKTTLGKEAKSNKSLYLIPFIIFYISIIHPKCLYSTIACSVNYLWSSVICLFTWLYFTQKTTIHKIALVPFYLLCFVAGWSHEGIVIPLSIALISYWFFEIKKIRHWKTVALLIFGIGATLLILAPGNFVRSGNAPFSIKEAIIRGLLFYKTLRVFFLLPLTLLFSYLKFGKNLTKTWAFQNKHLIMGIALSLPIFMYIGPAAPRVGFGIELFSAILLGSLINAIIAINRDSKVFAIAPYLCIIIPIVTFSAVLYYQINAGKQITYVIQNIESENSNIVHITIKNNTPTLMQRFVQQYSIKEAPDWNKSVWELQYNKTIKFTEP